MKKFIQNCGNVYRRVEKAVQKGLEWLGMVNAVGELLICGVLGPIALTLYLMYLLQPLLSWVVTALFVIIGTVYAFERRRTAAMSILGLVLYGMSWYVTRHYGIWPGMACWAAGVLTWFAAFIYSAVVGYTQTTPRTATA